MKTAEEWEKFLWLEHKIEKPYDTSRVVKITVGRIKQIQLDAMNRAVEIAHDVASQERIRTGKDNDYQIGARNVKQAIEHMTLKL